MKTNWKNPAAVFLALAVFAHPAFAWSGGGHKTVAIIAYHQLTPAQRAKVVEVLQSHPLFAQDFEEEMEEEIGNEPSQTSEERWLFAQAAIWPDIARKYTDEPKDYHRDKWHYINRPIYVDASSESVLKDHLPNQELKWKANIPEKELGAPQIVDYAMRLLTKPGGTALEKTNKAIVLCWLMHLVGDLHQPLHSVAFFSKETFPKGDHGGNYILLPTSPNQKKPVNLHSYWDHLHGGTVDLNVVIGRANAIMNQPLIQARAKAAATNLSMTAWLNEGYAIANQKAYTQNMRAAVKAAEQTPAKEYKVIVYQTATERADYKQMAQPIADERVAVAGSRLATLLRAVK